MALTGRQKDCLINNSTFRTEFATVLFPLAAGMLALA